jgi:hypothetical protein
LFFSTRTSASPFFEIKDWNLDAISYFVRKEAGSPSLWSSDQHGQQFLRRDNPVEKVVRYKGEILDLYCPRLGIQVGDDPQVMAAVTAGVIMTAASTERAADGGSEAKAICKASGRECIYDVCATIESSPRQFPAANYRINPFLLGLSNFLVFQ